MAGIGLYGVYYSKATLTSGVPTSYGTVKTMGKAISATFEPAETGGNPLYANNSIAETDAALVAGGTLTLTLDRLTMEARGDLFGLTMTTTTITVSTGVTASGFTKENLMADDDSTGILLFPNTYNDIKQIETKPFVADADQMSLINENVYNYFGVNKDILQNHFDSETWAAFYEGCCEPFAIQLSECLSRMLFTYIERSNGNRVDVTANRLQYMSNQDKLNVSAQMLDRGIMTINEIRQIWQLPELENGDVRIIRGEYYNADEKVTEEES